MGYMLNMYLKLLLEKCIEMGVYWIRVSVFYFLFGISIGLFMSGTLQLNWAAAHAHVNLVGWVSGAIIGLVYSVFPKAGNSAIGKWSFWTFNIGLPLLLASMFMVQIEAVRGIAHTFTFTGGGIMTVGVILFAVNIFMNVKPSDVSVKY